MFDQVPPPFGDVTRLWTQLTDEQRHRHAARLLTSGCGDVGERHVGRPILDDGVCYLDLVAAACVGDPVALGWLATTHRAVLLVRGQALYEHDPAEWGAVGLEALHLTLERIDVSIGRWLRRRFAQNLARYISRATADHLDRTSHEIPTSPELLHESGPSHDPFGEPQLDLTIALEEALSDLAESTRDGFVAVAEDRPLAEVGARHGLSANAIKCQLKRARPRIQPELVNYVRAAVS